MSNIPEQTRWRFSRRTLAWGGIALAVVILLSVNLITSVGLSNWQADLTEDRLFTISNGTKEVLRGIEEPITVRLYFSKRLGEVAPGYGRYFDRVRTLLERYKSLSGGKLQVAYLDPEPFSDEEDRAVAAGLHSVTLNDEGETGYFGLTATNSTDNQQTIEFFQPDREPFLEYDITKLIYTLANPKKRVVGLITALPLDGGKMPMTDEPTPPWLMMQQIRDFFTVRTLDETVDKIPSDIDVLLIAEPYGLTPKAAYAIDQYVLKGGKALVLVDPVPEAAQEETIAETRLGLDELGKVLKAWGVGFDRHQAATDIGYARRVRLGQSDETITDYVAWLALDNSSIDKNDVLSAGVDTLNLASPGFLTKIDGASTTFTPIVHTSPKAMVVDVSKVGITADPMALLRSYEPGGKPLTLAARISGEAKSAYPDGPPGDEPSKEASAPGKPATDTKPDQTAQAKPDQTPAAKPDKTAGATADQAKAAHVASGKINVIVIADTDLMADPFWVDRAQMLGEEVAIPNAQNAAFVVGALENLSGNDALIALRGRGITKRPFTYVEYLRRQAEKQYREKEQQLSQRLKEIQDQLAKLDSSGKGSVILTDEEQKAAENFRSEMVETRRELRSVQLALHRDIDNLDGWLKFANIALVPLAIGAAGAGLSLWRVRKRKGNDKEEDATNEEDRA
jgi:gliding motility-associatede transport system auxiliary component